MKTIQIDESLYVVVPRQLLFDTLTLTVGNPVRDKLLDALYAPEQPQDDEREYADELETVAINALLSGPQGAPATAQEKDSSVIRAVGDHAAEPAVSSVDDLRTALLAAVAALRSYQYGNAATDLAEEVADKCAAILNETKP